jgi:hypothetical protein
LHARVFFAILWFVGEPKLKGEKIMTQTEMQNMVSLGEMVAPKGEPNEGDLRVWHVPQVPGKAFYVAVNAPFEGKRVLDILAAYDGFQLAHNIKPDYCNAGGLEVWEDGEWCDWCDPEDGFGIDEFDLKDGKLVVPALGAA